MQPAQQQSRQQASVLLPSHSTLACSPFCWAIRFALIHKGLKYKVMPWHFQEQDKIKFSNQGLVRQGFPVTHSVAMKSRLPSDMLSHVLHHQSYVA